MSFEVRDVSFSYGGRQVLDGIGFTAELSEFICVIGPNGAGKSTLFKCMVGILEPGSGEIFVCHKPVRGEAPGVLAKRVAYIPQSHVTEFSYSVIEMVMMGTVSGLGRFGRPGNRERKLALEMLDKVGIADLADRDYMNLSGGEQQLVLVARALAQRAKVLVMDEPVSNLDFGNQLRIMERMKMLTKEGYTVIMSTHNPEQAYMFADTILAISHGRMVAYGSPRDVITADIIKELYGIDARLVSLDGDRMRVCIPERLQDDETKNNPKGTDVQ